MMLVFLHRLVTTYELVFSPSQNYKIEYTKLNLRNILLKKKTSNTFFLCQKHDFDQVEGNWFGFKRREVGAFCKIKKRLPNTRYED